MNRESFSLFHHRRLRAKLWCALIWSMQHLFGFRIVKLRFNKWRKYRGRQPTGPAEGDATLVVLARCSMSCNGQLWRSGGISSLYVSSARFIVGLCQLIKTSTRSSHNSQHCRPQTYSYAQNTSFSPRHIPHWNSLFSTVVTAKTTDEYRARICDI